MMEFVRMNIAAMWIELEPVLNPENSRLAELLDLARTLGKLESEAG